MTRHRRRSGLAPAAGILLFAGLSVATGLGCTDGVTPVCDDAGSCLIAPPPQSDATVPADASSDAQGDAQSDSPGDAPIDTGAPADASGDVRGDAPSDGAAD